VEYVTSGRIEFGRVNDVIRFGGGFSLLFNLDYLKRILSTVDRVLRANAVVLAPMKVQLLNLIEVVEQAGTGQNGRLLSRRNFDRHWIRQTQMLASQVDRFKVTLNAKTLD
jgi:hypothetical protein